jgi:hypothetical protein
VKCRPERPAPTTNEPNTDLPPLSEQSSVAQI